MKQIPRADYGPEIVPYADPRSAALGRPRYVDYAGEGDGPNGAPSGSLLEYLRILQRRRGTVVLIAFFGLVAGFLYTFPQTPVYQARAVIEVQAMNEDFLHMREVSPTNSGSSGYYPDYDIQTQVRVLQSHALLDRVVNKVKSSNKPLTPKQSRISGWRTALGLSAKPYTREGIIAAAAGGLRVHAQPNTRLIEILCDSTSPQIAAEFANALAAEFIEQNLEARWQTTQHTGEWLARQMEDLKIKLEKSEEALQNYARETGLQFTEEKDNVAEQKLKQLQDELSKAEAERVARQSRYELAMRTSADSIPEVLDDPSLKDIQNKLTDLRRQQAELLSSYTAAHPKVKKVQAQIVPLEAALDRARANVLGRIRNEFETAQRRERLLAAGYTAQARLVSAQADKVSHYNILKGEVNTNRQLYDNMLQRVKEAGIASALRASNVRIVDPAEAPGRPYKPNVFINSTFGLLSGAFLGIVFVVFRERADRTIQEPGDVNFYLGVAELGLIPRSDADPVRKRRLLSIKSSADLEQCLELATWQQRPSALAESFRATITSIMFSGEKGKRPRVIVVSSAVPGEGKTTVTANLAIALAEIRQRVLLIDADLRRARLHRIFGVENSTGIVDLLRSANSFEGPLNGLAKKTQIPNLWVLPSGPAEQADTALLHSGRLAELLRQVRQEYDTVLIDTPPMLTMADARIIGRACDAVILVARSNETTKEALRAACQRFAEDGTPVLGTVLNDWNPKRTDTYGYYGYYDKYKQYYAKPKE